MQHSQARRVLTRQLPVEFGQHITADHVIALGLSSRSAKGHTTALLICDLGTDYLAFPALMDKKGTTALAALRFFLGTTSCT